MTGFERRLCAALLFGLAACGAGETPRGGEPPTPADAGGTEGAGGDAPAPALAPAATPTEAGSGIPCPAPDGAAQPNLTLGLDGRPHLTWLEPAAAGWRLRLSVRAAGGWTPPVTIAEHEAMLANWADFPSLLVRGDGQLVAHWMLRRPDARFGYDLRYAVSADAGTTWSASRALHDDDTPTEHGFASLVPWPNGQVGVAWLDGRNMTGGHGDTEADGEMSLRFARLTADGQIDLSTQIDARVCECCGTTAVPVTGGMVIFYRDRSDAEVRDVSRVRVSYAGVALEPAAPVSADEWRVAGCPVNGPAAAAVGELVAVAWFTEAGGLPSVQVAFSNDGGAVFAPAIQIARDSPLGRVSLVLLDPRTALVGWLDGQGERAAIRARSVKVSGELGTPLEIATTSAARQSGFPRMVADGPDAVLVAWTDADGEVSRVRLARVAITPSL